MIKTVVSFFVIVFTFVALNAIINSNSPLTQEIPFNQFLADVKNGDVSEVTFKSYNKITGSYKNPKQKGYAYFQTVGDTSNPKIFEILEKNNVIPNYEPPEKPSVLKSLLVALLPVFILIGLFMFLTRKAGGGSPVSSFGKNKSRMFSENQVNIRFSDVAGAEEAKEELKEIVDFLSNPNKFVRLGGEIPKGVLMVGPPGTGKTLIARAVAGEAHVPFFAVSGSDFVEMFVGVGASRVRDLFEEAKKNAPCIVFIDEIDTIGKQRGVNMNGNDEREQTLNQLLVEMDGFETNEGVIVMGATNRVDILDKALLRPGRFDRRVTIGLPDVRGREAILAVHTAKIPMDSDVDLSVLAKGTSGFSGADLKNLANEAALRAASQDKLTVCMKDFEYAKDKIIMGVEKKSMVMSDKEKRVTAYHEAGHAIVGNFLENVDPIHKVTIIPRGSALGLTQTLPAEDRVSYSKQRAEDNIAFLMGGRIAEEIIIKEVTTGASNDIERATDLARRMVCEWGMSEKLGPLNYNVLDDSGFKTVEIAPSTTESIDREVKGIVLTNYERAKNLLTTHLDKLHNLAAALLEKETLDAEEVKTILNG